MQNQSGKKMITIVTPCYNEELNVEELFLRVKSVFEKDLSDLNYKHLFIDNASKDNTVKIIKQLSKSHPNVQLIVNLRNFGHIRSPYHALLQAEGDAVLLLVADFQDPPELIPELVRQWQKGCPIVVGVKKTSEESFALFLIRGLYYKFINRLSEIELIKNTTGFGIYDRQVIEGLRKFNDPYPYFRGLISELGFPITQFLYDQPVRKRGLTKNNFYTLYDLAMLGITSHSKVPLRFATMAGFAMSAVSLLIAMGYFVAKMIFWNQFELGLAPVLIGVFFFASVQLFFIGILGEYIGSIYTQIKNRPLVIEKERIGIS